MKICKAIILFFLIILPQSPVFAENALYKENNTVKIYVLKGFDKKKNPLVSLGTGFVLNKEGYIATNLHVVNSSKAVKFVLRDGQRKNLWEGFKAPNVEKKLVWSSSELDLAIIKIKPEELDRLNLVPVTLTNITPSIGSVVYAKGYPGLQEQTSIKTAEVEANSTFTKGDVANLNKNGRWIGSKLTLSLILHTAAISKGNSGGPLFDECSRVVGVNTQKPLDTGRGYVLDKNGKAIAGTEIKVQNASFASASNANELIDILKTEAITYSVDNEVCLSKEEKIQKNFQVSLLVGAAAFVLFSLLMIYAIRKSSRAKVANIKSSAPIAESAPQSQPQPSAPRPDPIPTQKPDMKQSSHHASANLILDGYGNAGGGLRLIIGEDELQQREVIIGRTPDNHYHINDDSVSRQHCVMYSSAGKIYIYDSGSTNGTFVNSVKLQENEHKVINNGDDLKLGSVSFKIIAD